MLYRKFGQTGKSVSVLRFDTMWLPTIWGYYSKIDEEKAVLMTRYATDQASIISILPIFSWIVWFNSLFGRYFMMMGTGKRSLAIRLSNWLITSREDMDCYLNEQLEKFRTNYIDFCLLHVWNKDSWKFQVP